MQIGETPNEVYNRRNQVHRMVEMENFTPEDDADTQRLMQEGQQQQLLNRPLQPKQEPVGCLARFFGVPKPKPQKDDYKPTELRDHYDLHDEQWFLDQRKVIEQKITPDGTTPHEIIHIIQHDDTLEGLELQYGVSAYRIRTYNNLQTNDIFYLKQLLIPDPVSDYQKQEIDLDSYMKELKIHKFLDEICQPEDRNRKVALFYLDMNEWNYKTAAQEYITDYKFELEQQKLKKVPHNKVVV